MRDYTKAAGRPCGAACHVGSPVRGCIERMMSGARSSNGLRQILRHLNQRGKIGYVHGKAAHVALGGNRIGWQALTTPTVSKPDSTAFIAQCGTARSSVCGLASTPPQIAREPATILPVLDRALFTRDARKHAQR